VQTFVIKDSFIVWSVHYIKNHNDSVIAEIRYLRGSEWR